MYAEAMTDNAASSVGPLVTGAEIARLAGVTRAAVSNWRRRYDDFPAPAGGGANSPLYALAEVQEWLDRQRKGQEVSPEVELWQAMRAAYGEQMVAGLAQVAAALADRTGPELPDDVAARVRELARTGSPVDLVNGLTERFMDSARRAGSDQVTSERVVRAVCHFAPELPSDATVFDPACGIGVLLLSVASEAGILCRGQELDTDSARFAQLRADLLGRSGVRIVAGDSLRADEWQDLRADLVVCDPPAGVTEWGREELLLDSRWDLGTPSKAEGELAWLQHAYAHTVAGGQVLMVMPASVAYRKAGRRIRSELVRRGIVRQVVALPPGTATSHALPVHLWCLQRPESPGGADTQHTVRMVDLTDNSPDGDLEPRPDQVADVPLIELLDDTVDLTPGAISVPGIATTLVSTPLCARNWRTRSVDSPPFCPSWRRAAGRGHWTVPPPASRISPAPGSWRTTVPSRSRRASSSTRTICGASYAAPPTSADQRARAGPTALTAGAHASPVWASTSSVGTALPSGPCPRSRRECARSTS